MFRILSTLAFLMFMLMHVATAPVIAAGSTMEMGETSRNATLVSGNYDAAGNVGNWQQQRNVAPDEDLPRLSVCPDHCVWLAQALVTPLRTVSGLRAHAGFPSAAPVPFEVSLPPPQ